MEARSANRDFDPDPAIAGHTLSSAIARQRAMHSATAFKTELLPFGGQEDNLRASARASLTEGRIGIIGPWREDM